MSGGRIYIIHNCVNDKKYIGQTILTLQKRKNLHFSNYRAFIERGVPSIRKLHYAMAKHGVNNFKFEELFYVFDENDLDYYESLFIKEFNSVTKGYNIENGGGVYRNRVYSEADKLRMKNAFFRNGVSINLGRKASEETKKLFSEIRLGEKNHMYGKTHSLETRKKISNMFKGENHPIYGEQLKEPTKSKLSEANGVAILLHGKIYRSMTLAEKETGISRYKLRKMLSGGELRYVNPDAAITRINRVKGAKIKIEGIEYESRANAAKSLGTTERRITYMLNKGIASYV